MHHYMSITWESGIRECLEITEASFDSLANKGVNELLERTWRVQTPTGRIFIALSEVKCVQFFKSERKLVAYNNRDNIN